MAFDFGFYNAVDHDRVYNAVQFGEMFDGLINDGIYATIGQAFSVRPGGGMNVIVGTGRAWFNRTWNVNSSEMSLTIDVSDLLLPRYDAVILEVDKRLSSRTNSIKVLKGTPATVPVLPTLTYDDGAGLYQYLLASVYVKENAEEILKSNIENFMGRDRTPFVTGILQSINIDAAFLQWEGNFEEWFENVRTTLGEDAAGSLLVQIENTDKKVEELRKNAVLTSQKATASDVVNHTTGKYLTADLIPTINARGGEIGEIVQTTRQLDTNYWMPCQGQFVSPSYFSDDFLFEYGCVNGIYNVTATNKILQESLKSIFYSVDFTLVKSHTTDYNNPQTTGLIGTCYVGKTGYTVYLTAGKLRETSSTSFYLVLTKFTCGGVTIKNMSSSILKEDANIVLRGGGCFVYNNTPYAAIIRSYSAAASVVYVGDLINLQTGEITSQVIYDWALSDSLRHIEKIGSAALWDDIYVMVAAKKPVVIFVNVPNKTFEYASRNINNVVGNYNVLLLNHRYVLSCWTTGSNVWYDEVWQLNKSGDHTDVRRKYISNDAFQRIVQQLKHVTAASGNDFNDQFVLVQTDNDGGFLVGDGFRSMWRYAYPTGDSLDYTFQYFFYDYFPSRPSSLTLDLYPRLYYSMMIRTGKHTMYSFEKLFSKLVPYNINSGGNDSAIVTVSCQEHFYTLPSPSFINGAKPVHIYKQKDEYMDEYAQNLTNGIMLRDKFPMDVQPYKFFGVGPIIFMNSNPSYFEPGAFCMPTVEFGWIRYR